MTLGGAWSVYLECHQFRMPFSLSSNSLVSVSHMVLFYRGWGDLYTDSSSAWTLASTQRSRYLSHKSWCVNWFFKQSAVALAFSGGWNIRPEGPWIIIGVLGSSLHRRDFAMGQIAWGVTSRVTYSCFPPFKCLFTAHLPDWFRGPINCPFTGWIPGSLPQFS
jgi:hypothetical protein